MDGADAGTYVEHTGALNAPRAKYVDQLSCDRVQLAGAPALQIDSRVQSVIPQDREVSVATESSARFRHTRIVRRSGAEDDA